MNPRLSVIIPAYNEEHRFPDTLASVLNYLSHQPWTWEVIVVSDGSRDNTVTIAKDFAKKHLGIIVLVNDENHGKGYVVRQGMLAAHGELRLFMDADNATRLEEIEKFMVFLPKHDIIIGSLGVLGAQMVERETLIRIAAGKIGNLFIRLLLLPGIYDTQRGFKLFTQKAAEQIFSRVRIARWGFDVEALVLARALGFRIQEVPIQWTHHAQSKVGFFSYINTFVDVLRIRWWLWSGVYKI